jgi:hypothetical protein
LSSVSRLKTHSEFTPFHLKPLRQALDRECPAGKLKRFAPTFNWSPINRINTRMSALNSWLP